LEAADRVRQKENIKKEKDYASVVYGDHLVRKVGGNFTGERY